MPPLVSILLPIFNAGPTIELCVRSLLRQSLTDWECLLVDDGSTDDSLPRACAAAGEDRRFRILRREHAGLVATLEAGIDACTGRFVARMDADDFMHRDRLTLQVAALQQDPELELVGCHVRIFPRSTLSDGLRRYERWLASIRTTAEIERDVYIECPLAHPTWMLRRESLAQLRYRETGWAEDYDLLLRMIQRGGRVGVVPRRLVGWRDSGERLSRTDPRYALDRFTACRAAFLARGPLREAHGYLLWGYGATGRAIRAALAEHGKQLWGLVDVHPGRQGQRIHGAPVVAPANLAELPRHKLIVSVAGAGPRKLIRAQLAAQGWTEGRDFVCVA